MRFSAKAWRLLAGRRSDTEKSPSHSIRPFPSFSCSSHLSILTLLPIANALYLRSILFSSVSHARTGFIQLNSIRSSFSTRAIFLRPRPLSTAFGARPRRHGWVVFAVASSIGKPGLWRPCPIGTLEYTLPSREIALEIAFGAYLRVGVDSAWEAPESLRQSDTATRRHNRQSANGRAVFQSHCLVSDSCCKRPARSPRSTTSSHATPTKHQTCHLNFTPHSSPEGIA